MESHTFPVHFGDDSYDLKQFMRDHPGGVNTLQPYKGQNIKNAMRKFGHSISAYHMLNDLKVGEMLKDSNFSGVSGNGRILTKDEDTRDAQEITFLEELEGRIDWSKPILGQLDRIVPHYQQWVNTAVYRSGCRLFDNPLIETVVRYTSWYAGCLFWVPVILCLSYLGYMETVACGGAQLSNWGYLFHLLQGVLLWPVLEYFIHRLLFHLNPYDFLLIMQLHFIIHGVHHKVPFDTNRQVFPPLLAAGIAVILYFVAGLIMPYPILKVAGALIGYLPYEMLHYYLHHGSPSDGSYLYAMKRYHYNHHFVNHDKAFGVSSKFWDHVFRTFVNVKELCFSLKW